VTGAARGRPEPADRLLAREIHLQDLTLALYGVYLPRIRDAGGRAILETYVRAEEDRRRRIERYLEARGGLPPPSVRGLFAAAGRLYGRVTSRLGTRVMLRIALSAAGRAARRACAAAAGQPTPELQFLATLRAKNEEDLLLEMRQHLIDTRPRRG
jgi:hypothetical protein